MNIEPKTKTKIPAPAYRKRTLSRLIAIQIFYQFEFHEEKIELEEIKNTIIDNYVLESEENISSYRKKIDQNLLNSLLAGIALGMKDIDSEIESCLKDKWELQNLPDVMLYVLRLGAFELRYMHDVPVKVVLGEYVDIAASFFENKKVTFVNATLESIAKKHRADELQQAKTAKNV